MTISKHQWKHAKDHRAALMGAIADSKAANPGCRLGVGGTWAGPKTLFDDERTSDLAAWISETIGLTDISAWGVEHAEGDNLAPHDHIKSHKGGTNQIAGVYFLQSGGKGDAFCREGQDIKPKAGMLLTFPADLRHWTAPATKSRLSIAFNARA